MMKLSETAPTSHNLTMILSLAALVVMVALGAVARRIYRVDAALLSAVTMDLLLPPFIFLSIVDARLEPSTLFHPAMAAAVVILGSIAVLYVLGRLLKKSLLPLALPVAFMNSGYLAIPVAQSLGGNAWVSRAVVYDQMMNVLIFTAGIGLVSGVASIRDRLRLFAANPAVIAIGLGAIWKAGGADLPEGARMLIRFPVQAAIPLALFSLGAALCDLRVGKLRPILLATAGRYGLGLAFACLYIAIARPDPDTAKVILLSSTMPAAVFSFLLSERYGGEADYAAGVVLFSTTLYPVVLMALIWIFGF